MTANNMKPQGRRRRRTGTPSLRGLQGRSATGQNGQAAKEELSAIWGAGCRKNNSGVPAGRSVFHLTSPFIGLSQSSRSFPLFPVFPKSVPVSQRSEVRGQIGGCPILAAFFAARVGFPAPTSG